MICLLDQFPSVALTENITVRLQLSFLESVRSVLSTDYLNSLYEGKVCNVQTRKTQVNLFLYQMNPARLVVFLCVTEVTN